MRGSHLLICKALLGIVGVAQVLHISLLCQGAIVAEYLQVALLIGVKRLRSGKPDIMIPSIDVQPLCPLIKVSHEGLALRIRQLLLMLADRIHAT